MFLKSFPDFHFLQQLLPRSASQLMFQAGLRANWNLWLGPCTQVLLFMVHPLWLPFSRTGSETIYFCLPWLDLDICILTCFAPLSGICTMTGLLSWRQWLIALSICANNFLMLYVLEVGLYKESFAIPLACPFCMVLYHARSSC